MNLRWHLNIWLIKLAIALLRWTGWFNNYWGYWRTIFDYAQRKGLHIIPVHYYSPVPDTRNLPDHLWQTHRTPVGFDLNVDKALNLLDQLGQKYGSEYNSFPRERTNDVHRYHLNNTAYQSGDAEILYAMLRDLKPRRIVEIGSGYSTLLICQAIRANREEVPDYRCEFTAIEPYPPSILTPPPREVARVDSRPLQQIELDVFESLGENDVLFVDSTHVARIGSDVIHEYLTIIPSLSPGVVVHIHDIFIPAEYPHRWIEESRFFWNEQYLVEAFLTYNYEFDIIMPTHALSREHADHFRKAIPSCELAPHAPSSFWIRRRRPR